MKRFLAPSALLLLMAAGIQGCLSDKAPAPITGPIDSAKYTYDGWAKAIFDQNCNNAGCHNARSAQSNIVLDNYEAAKDATLNKRVICTIEWACSPHMPDGASKLPDTTINGIIIWRSLGCPQN